MPSEAPRLQPRRQRATTQVGRRGAVELVAVQLALPLETLEASRSIFRRRRGQAPSRVAAAVGAFHRAFALPRRRLPSLDGIDADLLALRRRLLDEEAAEFGVAAEHRDLVAMADALADVVYVAYGTAVTLGLDLDAVLDEVHRSNMSKLDDDGRPLMRADGKVLKSARYSPPDVAAVLDAQLALPY